MLTFTCGSELRMKCTLGLAVQRAKGNAFSNDQMHDQKDTKNECKAK